MLWKFSLFSAHLAQVVILDLRLRKRKRFGLNRGVIVCLKVRVVFLKSRSDLRGGFFDKRLKYVRIGRGEWEISDNSLMTLN